MCCLSLPLLSFSRPAAMSLSFPKKRKMRRNMDYLFQFTLGQVIDLPKFVKVNFNSGVNLDYVAIELQDSKKNKKVKKNSRWREREKKKG